MLGMYLENQLKKFIKRKGFYKPVKEEEEDDKDKEKEEGDKLNKAKEVCKVKVEEKSKNTKAEFKLMDFEIQLPTLTAEQRSQYIQYKEDKDKNIL